MPILYFKEDAATFYALGDTILNFTYQKHGNVINLLSLDSMHRFADTIVFISDTSIRPKTLAGLQNTSIYIKQ